MTTSEMQAALDFEKNLKVGQPVDVKWTAGSAGHYMGAGTVSKINAYSVRVALTSPVDTGEWGTYPVGHEIVVPKCAPWKRSNRWASFNRIEPAGGYPSQYPVCDNCEAGECYECDDRAGCHCINRFHREEA